MNHIDLFSGIGGFALGAKMAGWNFKDSFYSDIEPYANKVYAKNFPAAIPLGDIAKIDYERLRREYGGEWVATGGFPCQPHSIAGKRRGSEDERDLWSECVRMLRILRPRYAIFENVPALFISNIGEFFNRVIADIASCGYAVEWQVISAQEIGAQHQRKRVWIIAYADQERRSPITIQQKEYNWRDKWEEIWEHFLSFSYSNGNVEFRKEDESRICRMDDGVSLRVDTDRIACLGNSVVPQVASIPLRLCLDHYNDSKISP